MFGIVTYKGNQIDQIEELICNFGYLKQTQLVSFDSFVKMESYLLSNYFSKSKLNKGIKGFWTDGHWTYVYDPELVDPTDTDALIKNSKLLNSEIHSFISENKSGTYVYAKYNQIKVREVFYSSNKLVDDFEIKNETDQPLDLSNSLNEQKLISYSEMIGLNIMGQKCKGQFTVGEFDLDLKSLSKTQKNIESDNKSIKWWKFW